MEFPYSRIVLPMEQWRALRRTLRWAYRGVIADPRRHARPFEGAGGWLVLDGEARVRVKRRISRASRGEWLIPPPRGVTEQSFAPQTELLSVRFDLHWPDGRPLFDLDLPVIASAADFPDLRTSATALAGACLGTPLDAPGAARVGAMAIEQFARIEMAFAAYLVQWIDVLRSAGVTPTPDVPPDARVAEALRLLQDQDLPTPDLAKRLNLSISQLDRLFVRHVGRTPSAWREQRRLDRVRRALRHSTQPIKAIAYAEGFKRLSHFSAWFSRHAGLTARAYRQRGDASA